MPAKTTAMATNFLKLLYQAVAWANVADNAATAPLTNVYASAHTADPGVGGDQTTGETSYTGYARQAIARSTAGWTVASGAVSPVNNIVFPVSTAGTPTLTFMGTGSGATGAGNLFHRWTITPNIIVSTSVPQTVTNGSSLSET